ncbi:MAG: SDR family NAD(P)-dependent oxidoreductase [Saprospiraceae bacterium]|nr:SDR family NAD(P)-dependent oxidoreductase [Saprospiraceae bacterium]
MKQTFREPPAGSYALVTGGSHGIGRSIAEILARRGYNILLVALPTPELDLAKIELAQKYGVQVESVGLDLTCENAAQAVLTKFNQLDARLSILVNNAGIGYLSRFEDNPLSYYVKLIRLNAVAMVQMTHIFLPALRRESRAYILNMGSMASLLPLPFKSVYAASKHFVKGFSLSLREELRSETISVTTVCPNAVLTNQHHRDSVRSVGWLAGISALTAQQVAQESVMAMFRRKGIVVPGVASKVYQAIHKMLPHRVVMSLLRRQLKKLIPVVSKFNFNHSQNTQP